MTGTETRHAQEFVVTRRVIRYQRTEYVLRTPDGQYVDIVDHDRLRSRVYKQCDRCGHWIISEGGPLKPHIDYRTGVGEACREH